MVIDAHHHLWDPGRIRYTCLEAVPALHRPFLAADYDQVAARCGLAAAVCVEAAMAGANGVLETDWLLAESARCRTDCGVVIWAPLESPSLDLYLAGRRVCGVRRALEREPAGFARSPEVIRGVRTLASRGLVFELALVPGLFGAAFDLVRDCPETQFVLDHLGKPPVRDRALGAWLPGFQAMARLPNVTCKISGLTTEAEPERWTRNDLEPYILHAIACFGWERVLFGSDWPVCLLAGGVERWLDALLWVLRDAGAAEIDKLLSANAARVYKLDPEDRRR